MFEDFVIQSAGTVEGSEALDFFYSLTHVGIDNGATESLGEVKDVYFNEISKSRSEVSI